MPRKHERRAYCVVPTAVWQEDSTPEERGICVALVAYMVERWARDKLTAEEAATVHLRPGVLAEITGRERPARGLARLRQALGKTSARVWQEGRNVVVEWPKVPIYQRLDRLSAPLSVSGTASAPAKRKKAAARTREAPLECPEVWSPEAVGKLLAWSERKKLNLQARDIEWAIEKVHRWSVKTGTKRTPRGWHTSVQDAITSDDRWGLAGRPWAGSSGGQRSGRDSHYTPPATSSNWSALTAGTPPSEVSEDRAQGEISAQRPPSPEKVH